MFCVRVSQHSVPIGPVLFLEGKIPRKREWRLMTHRRSVREFQSQEGPKYNRDRGRDWSKESRLTDSETSAISPSAETHRALVL